MTLHAFTNLHYLYLQWWVHTCSSISLWNATSTNKPRENKLCNNSPCKCCASCACVFVCFCVCFCHTHELHPVLIKAGCSFYIITECAACLQQILLLSLLFAAPQSGSRRIHHPAIPSYCSPSLCNLLHAFLLLPFPPLTFLFPSPVYPPCISNVAKEVRT